MGDNILKLVAVLFSGLVLGGFGLPLGVLILLQRSSKAKKQEKKHTLAGSFITGVGTMAALILMATGFLLIGLGVSEIGTIWWTILLGVLVAAAVVVGLFYWRRGTGSRMWITKGAAEFFEERAGKTRNDTEAFSLGMMAVFCEIPLSLAVFMVGILEIIELPLEWQLFAVAGFVLMTVLPIFITNCFMKSSGVVGVQRGRERHKRFLQVVMATGMIALALFILVFEVI